MNKLKLMIAGLLMVPTLAFAVAPVADAQTKDLNLRGGVESAKGEGSADKVDNPSDLVKSAVNIVLYVVGVLAVIMLIWGGITYTTSAGDSNKVTSAKNTIMYAVIGLVVAIFAYAIVNFVLTSASGS